MNQLFLFLIFEGYEIRIRKATPIEKRFIFIKNFKMGESGTIKCTIKGNVNYDAELSFKMIDAFDKFLLNKDWAFQKYE